MFILTRRCWAGDHGREPWKRLSSSAAANPPGTGSWGGGGAHGSIQPAWEQSRETLTHRREAGGSEAQMPSCKLVLHMNAFLPTTSEQLT